MVEPQRQMTKGERAIESMMPALDITDIQAKLVERARNSPGYRGPHLITDET